MEQKFASTALILRLQKQIYLVIVYGPYSRQNSHGYIVYHMVQAVLAYLVPYAKSDMPIMEVYSD